MKVIRAEVLGFCMGVRRAVDLACGEASAGRVYTLGPLIHNPQALDDLKSRGVQTLDESSLPRDLNGVSVIIRAHGISPLIEAQLREKGAEVIDATCPRVKASQLKAATLAEAGCRLFLAGEERHAEIIGIKGYCGEASFCAIVSDAAEAEAAAAGLHAKDPCAATALIGQTTISAQEYHAIGEAIRRYFPGIEIAQTICAATSERQESLRKLLGKVDAVIIAGGKDSANTRRLLAIAQAADKPCVLAEAATDIPPAFAAFETVGIAAGASTPDFAIEEIERALEGKGNYLSK